MEHNLIMPFVDQSNQFTHGFECGQIWEQMKLGKGFDGYLFHENNKKQVEMMCQRFGYAYSIEVVENCWLHLNGVITN